MNITLRKFYKNEEKCSICLESKKITHYCNGCKTCQLCGDCISNLTEHGLLDTCPTCRKSYPWLKSNICNIPTNIPDVRINLLNTNINSKLKENCIIFIKILGLIIISYLIGCIYSLFNKPQYPISIALDIMLKICFGIMILLFTGLILLCCLFCCLLASKN